MLIIRKTPELTLRTIAIVTSNRLYSKDYSSSDDEKEPKKQKKPKVAAKEPTIPEEVEQSAAARLNQLLGSMRTDDTYTLAKKTNMARPGEANKKRKEAVKQEAASKDVIAAAKRVASLLSEGEESKKKTESELLAKLLGHNQDDMTTTTTAKSDASTSPGQEHDLSLSELIVGMKIDRRQQQKEQVPTRSEFVRRTLSSARSSQQQKDQSGRRYSMPRHEHKREPETYTGSVNLFGGPPLGIFKDAEALRDSPDILSTWAQLRQRELKLSVAHPPANYFEKMALWTEQGKAWRFPIDNEQDLNEEAEVDFSEHVFLEQHLEPWCPSKGPVRHFMELVCVGLSKNPYITAKDKKDHIHWYRDYFEEKKDILKDLMSREKMEQLSTKLEG